MTTPKRPPTLDLLTVNEFAAECSVHPKTVRRWINSGKLPAYRLHAGKRMIRLHRRDLDLIVRRVHGAEVSP